MSMKAKQQQLPLPEGWVEGFDSKYNRKFYFHKPTKQSTWTRPAPDSTSGDGEALNMSAQLSQISINSTPKMRRADGSSSGNHSSMDSSTLSSSSFSRQQQQQQEGSKIVTSPVIKKRPSSSSSSHLQPVSKFDVWIEVYSEEHKRNFFFNKVTRESVWLDPRTPSTPPQQQQQRRPVAAVAAKNVPAVLAGSATNSGWETVGPSTHSSSSASAGSSSEEEESPAHVPKKSAPAAAAAAAAASTASQSRMRIVDNSSTTSAAVPSTPGVIFLHPTTTASVPSAEASPPASQSNDRASSASTMMQEDKLGDELRSFAKNLAQEKDLIAQHSSKLDAKSRAQLDELDAETNELTRTAEAMANSSTSGSKRSLLGKMMSSNSQRELPSALASWGVEPPKVIEVKRAMKDVEQGIKYAQEELKAHGEAATEAKLVDSEGGYYNILGVSPDADLSTMKKAFRKAMIKTHPDKVAPEDRDKAQELAGMLQNAFACLSDEWERYLYDYFGLRRYLQNAKVIQCFKNYLLSGIEIIKHPRQGYPRRRFFWISPDFEWLMTGRERILEPNEEQRALIKGVRISDIHDITRGITTEVFERTGKTKKQSRYFSIITNERTLDLEAESKERADFLVSRISLLVLDTQKNKKWLQRFFELKALKDASEAKANGFSFRNTAPPQPQQ